jgi:Fe/S biogenesis protein NfuA
MSQKRDILADRPPRYRRMTCERLVLAQTAAALLEYPSILLGMVRTMITITQSAQDYLAELLAKQEDALGVRVFINQPGTPRAETCIAYCRDGDVQEGDEERRYGNFTAWIEGRSLPYLEDALVDYARDRMGGQLTIKAPNAKMPRVDENSPLEDRINYILYNEINPALASHGGEVSLVELTDDGFAVLRFGGGCQGCSAVDQTLKGGVEKTLLEQLPQLRGVRDLTDHSDRSQAYY